MKTILLLFFLIVVAGCTTLDVEKADSIADQLLDKVVVERIDLDFDSPREDKGDLLWNNFAGKPYEDQFSELSTKNWYVNCQKFRDRLISRAQAGGFDADSLRRILDGLNFKQDDKTARIPVGAFAAHKGIEDVWIIVLKWEYPGSYEEDGKLYWHNLGHIEVIAFRMKDGKEVDSVKCG